jgi:hypothetical protein
MKSLLDNWQIWLVISLTLGLAPFMPEPHLLGKIRWVLGGAIGMKPIDWLDLVFHGFPFLLLIRAVYIRFWK